MSAQGFDLGALGDVLSSLSADDIAALQDVAASVFSGGGGANARNQSPPKETSTAGAGEFGGPDLKSIARIASVLELLQSDGNDPRTALLQALRPLLSEARRPKVDQAMRMLQLFSLLPKLKATFGE